MATAIAVITMAAPAGAAARPAVPMAGAGTAAVPKPPGDMAQQLRAARTDAAAVRKAMSSGSLLAMVRASLATRGPVPAIPRTGPATLPAGVPTALVKPVSGLLGAIEYAGKLARKAVTPASGLRKNLMWAGGMLVARAIDGALPALRAYAAALPASSKWVSGCDEVSDAPLLCIGGNGNNTYTKDAALLIDFGGHNVHREAAGAADPGTPFAPGGNGLPAAVTIDLGRGNVYRDMLPAPTGARVAQGAGFGGIGFLVNYGAHARFVLNSSSPASMGALGQGWSALGVGVLANMGAHASYVLGSHPPGINPMGPGGTSGDGSSGDGLAILDQRGTGNSYLAESVPVPVRAGGKLHVGNPNVEAFGANYGAGAGVFYDGGGRTSVSAVARTRTVPASYPGGVAAGDALIYGFGYGSSPASYSSTPARHGPAGPRPSAGGYGSGGGFGMALSGPGDISYRATSQVIAPQAGWAGAYAFGKAGSAGTGVLSAAGGHDRFLIKAVSRAASSKPTASGVVTAAAGEAATGGFGDAGSIGLSPNSGYQPSSTSWNMAGVGVFQDESGRHRYTMTADSSADADAAGTGRPAKATTGGAWTEGQGYGDRQPGSAGSSPGGGFAFSSGDADYTAASTSRASSRADAHLGSTATAGEAGTYAQAYGTHGGYGELYDHGGTHHYVSTAGAATNTGPGWLPARAGSWSQASVERNGWAVLIDTGTPRDTFAELPADPACVGHRGTGVWIDCGDQLGIGIRHK